MATEAGPTPQVGGTTATSGDDRVLAVTERARAHLLELIAAEDDADALALRVEVTGATTSEFTYDLSFDRRDAAGPDDAGYAVDGLHVLVPAESVRRLRGSTLDLPGEGLVLRNPNRPSPYGGADDLALEGSVEDRITAVLDQLVNPGLAGHGGFAQLIKVEGDTAHLLMGGGCQGCGLAQATLTAGIEAALVDAVPEVTRVVDVTDHAAGEHPYYAPTP